PIARGLRITRAAALATVQDGGRLRHLAFGVPMVGAVDPVALAAANLALGNDAGAPGLEIATGSVTVSAIGALVLAIDGEIVVELADGDTLEVSTGPRLCRYVAVRGGIAVSEVLGGCGTAVAAALGGHQGRPLARGDVLTVGDDPGTRMPGRA